MLNYIPYKISLNKVNLLRKYLEWNKIFYQNIYLDTCSKFLVNLFKIISESSSLASDKNCWL